MTTLETLQRARAEVIAEMFQVAAAMIRLENEYRDLGGEAEDLWHAIKQIEREAPEYDYS